MGISHERVSITTVATKVSSDYAGKDGQTIAVQNPTDGVIVYLGGAGVTTTDYGFALEEKSTFSIDIQSGETMYGIVASGTQTVNVIRQGA